MIQTMNKVFGFDNSGNTPRLSKSFAFSRPFGRSKTPSEQAPQKMTLSQVKLKLELCIQDLHGHEAERLRFKIRAVRDVRELWMLRSDVHQVIAKQLGQQVAAQSINSLLPCFAGWIPSKQLSEI